MKTVIEQLKETEDAISKSIAAVTDFHKSHGDFLAQRITEYLLYKNINRLLDIKQKGFNEKVILQSLTFDKSICAITDWQFCQEIPRDRPFYMDEDCLCDPNHIGVIFVLWADETTYCEMPKKFLNDEEYSQFKKDIEKKHENFLEQCKKEEEQREINREKAERETYEQLKKKFEDN